MGKGFDLFLGIAEELLADHFQLFIKAGGAEHSLGLTLLHQLNKAGACDLGVAILREQLDRRRHQHGLILLR